MERTKKITEDFHGNLYMDTTMITNVDYEFGIQRTVNNLFRHMKKLGSNICPIRYKKSDGEYITSRKYICRMEGKILDEAEEKVLVTENDVCFFPDSSWDMEDKLLLEITKFKPTIYCIIYDLIPILYPGLHGGSVREYYTAWIQAVLQYADGCVCISRAVANDVIRYFHQNKERYHRKKPLDLYAIHLGFDGKEKICRTRGLIRRFVKQEGKTTFLMVGTVEPRKNHLLAMNAMKKIFKEYPQLEIQLLIMGKSGWLNEPFQEVYFHDPCTIGKVVWIQDAKDSEVQWAYANCSALLYPSKAEGFGLPLVEAAYYGLPILCSDIPVFREVTNGHADYFPVDDENALADAIVQWCQTVQHPKSDGIKLYSWEECAMEVMDILNGQAKPYATV